jgi:hypothetical protein
MENKLIEPPLADEVYLKVFNNLAHFSLKLVNSNTKGAIRVDGSYKKDLPYLALCTAQNSGIEVRMDYFKGALDAKAFKHLGLSLLEITEVDVNQAKEAMGSSIGPQSEQKALKDAHTKAEHNLEARMHYSRASELFKELSLSPGVLDVEALNPRITQLLVPKDGDYVSLSPIPSSGFGQYVGEVRRKTYDSNLSAFRSIGGANSQNIGGLVYHLRSPVFLSAPAENAALRAAMSLLHKGVAYRVPHRKFQEYLDWRGNVLSAGKYFDHDRRTKDRDSAFAKSLASDFLSLLELKSRDLTPLLDTIDVSLITPHSEYHSALIHFVVGGKLSRGQSLCIGTHVCDRIAQYKIDEKSLAWDEYDRKTFSKIIGDLFHG